jgi:chromosome segregation ATPase
VTDFEPTGFGALTGIKVPAEARTARARAKPTSAPKRERPSADEAKAERAELRARNRQARQSLVEARDHERELRQRVKKADKEAEQARKAADRAEAEAESLRSQAAEAAAAVAAAEQALFALRRAGG